MRQLILARHAKSDWADPTLRDHDRPLNARGLQNAPMMAERLSAAMNPPNRIISSTALRARTTAQAYAEALALPLELDATLYLASAATLWQIALDAEADSVVLVAHDPGLSDLAYELSSGAITRMPTCAVATFTWQTAIHTPRQPGACPADHFALDTPR